MVNSMAGIHYNRRGFTDRLYVYNVSFVTVIVALAFVLMFLSCFAERIDLSPLAYIVPSAFGELALHTGFIIWKAKTENINKHPNTPTNDILKNGGSL